MGPSFGTDWEAMPVSFTTVLQVHQDMHESLMQGFLKTDQQFLSLAQVAACCADCGRMYDLFYCLFFLSENRGTPFFWMVEVIIFPFADCLKLQVYPILRAVRAL